MYKSANFGGGYHTPEKIVKRIINALPKAHHRVRRLLLLADIHSNLHALDAVMEHAKGKFDAVWFLGDLIGYYCRPVECVSIFRQVILEKRRWVGGNHDWLFTRSSSEWMNLSEQAKIGLQMTAEKFNSHSDLKNWFAGQVRKSGFNEKMRTYCNTKLMFVHGMPSRFGGKWDDPIEKYAFPDHFINNGKQVAALPPGMVLITGHTHMVCLAGINEKGKFHFYPITYGQPTPLREINYLITPGSVGQPRDGDPRPAYAILDTEKREICFYRIDKYEKSRAKEDISKIHLMDGWNPEFLKDYKETMNNLLDTGYLPTVTPHFENVYTIRKDRSGVDPKIDLGE